MTRRSILVAAAVMGLAPIWGDLLSAAPPPGGGTISVEPKTADGEYHRATQAFVDAAAEALAVRGFTILEDTGHAAFVAELILSREEVGTGLAKGPADGAEVIPGASLGSGAGVTIPLSTGKSNLVPLQRTRLELRIHKRGEENVVWRGAAVTVREGGVRNGIDEAVAADLSEAILRDYPTEPAGVVGVP